MDSFKAFIQLLAAHWKKIFPILGFALLFAVILFPTNDLIDRITDTILEKTERAWYVQFDKMNLLFLPHPGLKLENVSIEGNTLPPISSTTVTAHPWLTGPLTGKTGFSADATDIFNGNVSIVHREGDKLKSGVRIQNIEVHGEKIALQQLAEFLRSGNFLNMALQGSLGVDSTLAVDPLFDTQPSGDISLEANAFVLPSQSFNSPLGPIPMPTLNLGTVALKSRVEEGKLAIENLSFGGQGSELSGKIHGELGMAFRRDNAGVRPILSGYDLRIELNVDKSMLEGTSPLSVALQMVNQYRTPTPTGARFAFRLKASSLNEMVTPQPYQ